MAMGKMTDGCGRAEVRVGGRKWLEKWNISWCKMSMKGLGWVLIEGRIYLFEICPLPLNCWFYLRFRDGIKSRTFEIWGWKLDSSILVIYKMKLETSSFQDRSLPVKSPMKPPGEAQERIQGWKKKNSVTRSIVQFWPIQKISNWFVPPSNVQLGGRRNRAVLL